MNINQAYLLIDLAHTHSFNQTAERNYTTQQSVSYQIKQLEQELQTRIFNRSKSGVEFTQQGEYVLECAYEMESAYHTMREKIELGVGNEKQVKKIRLLISSVLLSANMMTVIKVFNSKFPAVKLIIKEVTQERLVELLLTDEYDFALWSVNRGFYDLYEKACHDKGIESVLIEEDAAVAVISKKSPLASQEKLSLRDLTKLPKNVYGMHPVDYFKRNLESYMLYENNNLDIHKQLILEEGAICFTTEMIFKQLFPKDEFTARPFDYPTAPIDHMALKRVEREDTKEFQALEEIIAKIFT